MNITVGFGHDHHTRTPICRVVYFGDYTPAIKALNLISRINFVNSSERFVNLYPDLFNGLGTLDLEYHIQLKHDAKPYALTTPRRVAIPLMPKVKQELTRMESMSSHKG